MVKQRVESILKATLPLAIGWMIGLFGLYWLGFQRNPPGVLIGIYIVAIMVRTGFAVRASKVAIPESAPRHTK